MLTPVFIPGRPWLDASHLPFKQRLESKHPTSKTPQTQTEPRERLPSGLFRPARRYTYSALPCEWFSPNT